MGFWGRPTYHSSANSERVVESANMLLLFRSLDIAASAIESSNAITAAGS